MRGRERVARGRDRPVRGREREWETEDDPRWALCYSREPNVGLELVNQTVRS